MFNKQKEKLESQYNAKKYELKQAAKQITARIYGGDYSYQLHGNTYIEPNDIECSCRIYFK